MFRLFSSFRRSLTTDASAASAHPARRLRSFLLYAVGEIVLVVIGILIALEIGERAEIRSQEERVEQILLDVRSELEADVAQLTSSMELGAEQAEEVERVMNRDVDREDYRNCMRLCYLGFFDSEYATRRTARSRLSNLEGTFPIRYEEVRALLDGHYEGPAAMIDERSARSVEAVLDRRNRMVDEMSWGWRLLWERQDRPDEMIDWYLESERYRGWVALYRIESPFVEGTIASAARLSSIAAWVAISTVLGEAVDHPMVPEGLVVDDPAAVEPWLGDYRAEGDSTWDGELEIRGGVLHFLNRGGQFVQPMVELAERRYALPGNAEILLELDPDGDTILRIEFTGGRGGDRNWTFRRTDR